MGVSSLIGDLTTLRTTGAVELLLPDDSAYEDARRIHNGLIDKRPACIVRCRGVRDVVAALEMARRHGLEISVRGGGHNVGGRCVTEGGVMIDLSLMRDVRVDPQAQTARAEGGATWADFNRATQAHGLATTGGVISSTGVAGLTLGGGLGWLMSRHGMAVDNLLSAEVVTADGSVVVASETEHPDLFWAIRGGGGNFGVVTMFTFRLHRQGDVVGGLMAHPFDRAPEMLRVYRDATSSASDDLTLFAGLLHAPDGSGHKIAAIVACHTGDAATATSELAPLKRFGPPIMDVVGPMPYEQVNAMLDGGFPKGTLNYWKSSFLAALSDDALDTMVAEFAKCPAPMGACLLEHFHGEVTRVSPEATAYPHRKVGYNLLVAAQWVDRAQSAECIAWARSTYDAMRPFMASDR
jgi:FAD/FMN-containing dehydrogenase